VVVRHQQVAVGGQYNVERVRKGCIRALPVSKPFLPIAYKRADDGARLGPYPPPPRCRPGPRLGP